MKEKIRSVFSCELFPIISGGALFVCGIILSAFGIDPLCNIILAASLLLSGAKVYFNAVKGILRKDFLDERFLMSIASVGAVIIGEYTEGAAVMLFYLVGELFEHRAVSRSRRRIRALMDICPDEATVLVDGKEEVRDASDVEIGDTLLIKAGERVAVDVRVISGLADADTSAITGESIPRSVDEGSSIESGTVIVGGSLVCRAEKTAENSAAQRILDMVENATENKAAEERFITAFARIYTPIVVALAFLIAVIPPVFKVMSLSDSVYRAFIFLVVSCPCALVISVPLAFFGGIGSAASLGILFKGGSSFSPLSGVRHIAFDKTGTLTSGSFKIGEIKAFGIDESELLSLVSAVEKSSSHPIAKALSGASATDMRALNITELAGMGTVGTVMGKRVAVGNERLVLHEGVTAAQDIISGTSSVVFVVIDGALRGCIELADEIRGNADKAIKMLRKVGIKHTFMLSGDKKQRAEAIGKELQIDEVYSELSPDGKYEILARIMKEGKCAYVGDGINDAPSLALADVGIAMGGAGTDSAIETADLVITSDDLSRLSDAIVIAKRTLAIARFNIVFALAVKIGVMLLGALGLAGMWLAVFADVGVAVIAILISMQTLLFARSLR